MGFLNCWDKPIKAFSLAVFRGKTKDPVIVMYYLFLTIKSLALLFALLIFNRCKSVVSVHSLQVFSAVTGEFRFRFGRNGNLPGQLMRPTGIAVTSSGNYLVADYENCSLNVFRCAWETCISSIPSELLVPFLVAIGWLVNWLIDWLKRLVHINRVNAAINTINYQTRFKYFMT